MTNQTLNYTNNTVLVDFELHNFTLMLPTYNVEQNIYSLPCYLLNDTFTIKDRDNLLTFFKSNKVYVFKEGKFLDALFADENFDEDDGFFKLTLSDIKNLKKQFSSNKTGMKLNYLDGLPFFNTHNFIPTPTGDLKVIAYKLNPNLKQKYSTFSTFEEAMNYCRVNIKMICELYKYAIIDKKDVGLLHSQNCYGTIININGIGIVSPRILGEYGMWISSTYYYVKLNDKDSKNIDIKQVIRWIIKTWQFDKRKQIDTFLSEINKYGELL